MLTTAIPGAQAFSIVIKAAVPPKPVPYPTLVGTAITGAATSPPTSVGKAPSIPATTMITFAEFRASRAASNRCTPATPTSYKRSVRLPNAAAVTAASSDTETSAVPAQTTSTEVLVG